MKRIVTGLIIVFTWIALLFTAPLLLFSAVITLLAIMALKEYFSMIFPEPDSSVPVLIGVGALPLLAAFTGDIVTTAAATVGACLCMFAITLRRYAAIKAPLEYLSRSAFGFIYVSLFCAHIILIRTQPKGAEWLLLLTAITASSDTGAYYAGTLLGKNKLCPSISPGKTVEGFIGGLLAGALAAVALGYFVLPEVSALRFCVLAIPLTCIGVVGDLTESVLKRAAGVKDSGNILPGHGGILDRIDSLILAAPVLFYLLHFHFLGI